MKRQMNEGERWLMLAALLAYKELCDQVGWSDSSLSAQRLHDLIEQAEVQFETEQ